jgi:general nucleoside transport system ATP-binding protein
VTLPIDSERAHTPLLCMRAVTKVFPGVCANNSVDLDIYPSEVHALLGENGAGKSTLMKILYGFYRADSGSLTLHGQPIRIKSPADAREHQIGMVFQDFNLIPAFTVAENIALFLPDLKALLHPKEIVRRIADVSTRYDLQVDPHALVAQLAIGEQQKVEILKLLLSNARVLVLDEPTRVLAPHEIKALFAVLDNLRRDGYAIVLITHKLKEVLEIADRISVLRRGRLAGTLLRDEASEAKLIAMMFDKTLAGLGQSEHHTTKPVQPPVLRLENVSTRGQGTMVNLQDINLDIHPGEIVGVAGVSGNGQKELGDVVLGLEKCVQGRKELFGQEATRWSIGRIRRSGVAFIPESPIQMAVTPWLPVIENMALTRTRSYARLGGLWMDWKAVREEALASFERCGFPVPSLWVQARSLSGGNLQRLTISRELAHDPKLIVASYLTRGLDVQSALTARQALLTALQAGAGVLFISEDLEELFALSDRLVVLFGGRIVGAFRPEETDLYAVGHLMTGATAAQDTPR